MLGRQRAARPRTARPRKRQRFPGVRIRGGILADEIQALGGAAGPVVASSRREGSFRTSLSRGRRRGCLGRSFPWPRPALAGRAGSRERDRSVARGLGRGHRAGPSRRRAGTAGPSAATARAGARGTGLQPRRRSRRGTSPVPRLTAPARESRGESVPAELPGLTRDRPPPRRWRSPFRGAAARRRRSRGSRAGSRRRTT